ncbi:MAG: hypothetical protein K0R03_1081 [Moraxellaceae bacterium]|jgi:hypothetical protein|nr:hypothetical protein [Moraxellaceae bacterium]
MKLPVVLVALLAVAPAVAEEPAAPAPDADRVAIMLAIDAARNEPFVEPAGDIRAMLLRQNPELAAPDCGVRYKQLRVAGQEDSLTLLVAPQGRCRELPGMPPQWVLTVKVGVQRAAPAEAKSDAKDAVKSDTSTDNNKKE